MMQLVFESKHIGTPDSRSVDDKRNFTTSNKPTKGDTFDVTSQGFDQS